MSYIPRPPSPIWSHKFTRHSSFAKNAVGSKGSAAVITLNDIPEKGRLVGFTNFDFQSSSPALSYKTTAFLLYDWDRELEELKYSFQLALNPALDDPEINIATGNTAVSFGAGSTTQIYVGHASEATNNGTGAGSVVLGPSSSDDNYIRFSILSGGDSVFIFHKFNNPDVYVNFTGQASRFEKIDSFI